MEKTHRMTKKFIVQIPTSTTATTTTTTTTTNQTNGQINQNNQQQQQTSISLPRGGEEVLINGAGHHGRSRSYQKPSSRHHYVVLMWPLPNRELKPKLQQH
ncbi:hypothetical protein BLA29_007824 [Euroglyphus maynei]|uniref:Uncharacterized protein n=1 Tax=Euroglyphus maynei TaxID=6958 RepID=A0A1Y3BE41_EURMA|nr:hypothetical protein BLA29_007824 [Euroglyphus maynei]